MTWNVWIRAIVSSAAGLGAVAAIAQSYPARPLRVIVPVPVGSGMDVVGPNVEHLRFLFVRHYSFLLGYDLASMHETFGAPSISSLQARRPRGTTARAQTLPKKPSPSR